MRKVDWGWEIRNIMWQYSLCQKDIKDLSVGSKVGSKKNIKKARALGKKINDLGLKLPRLRHIWNE